MEIMLRLDRVVHHLAMYGHQIPKNQALMAIVSGLSNQCETER